MAWAGEGGPRLKTRNGADATTWFPEVVRGLAELPAGEHVLDGEVVVLDELGRTDFDKLHARAKARRWKPGLASVVYCVFDVVVHRGRDIRHQPLRRRQACLEQLLRQGAPSLLRVTGLEGQGSQLFHQARLLELEGIVAKRLDSLYLAGQRSETWLKVKRKGATPAQRFNRPKRRPLPEAC